MIVSLYKTQSYVDYYIVTPAVSGQTTIALESTQDPFLVLYQDALTPGTPYRQNDNYSGHNSRIQVHMVAGTKYIIGATTAQAGAVGTYTLRITMPRLTPLAVPTVTSQAGNGTVTLSWNAVTDATGYDIQQRTSDTAEWVTLATQGYTINSSGTSATATITGLTNGLTYQHQVRAKAPPSYSGWSTPVTRTTPTVVLTRPTGFVYTSGDRSVTLRWNSVTNALKYEVQQWVGTVNPGEWRTLPFTESPYTFQFTVTFNGTSATVGNLLVDSAYAHRVRAVNGKVVGPWAWWITTRTNAGNGARDAEPTPAPKKPKITPTPAPPPNPEEDGEEQEGNED